MPAVHCHPALQTAGDAFGLGKRDISVSSASLSVETYRITDKRRCYGRRTQKFMLVPSFLPLFLLRMFPVGAAFSLAWGTAEEAHCTVCLWMDNQNDRMDNPVCHHHTWTPS